MSIKRTFIAVLAVAIAAAFSPIPELQAATFNPGSQGAGSSSLVQTVKAKKKAYKKSAKRAGGKKRRKAGSKGKSCGTYMYRKGGKCLDARNKK
jgi:hypothetical protein